MDRLELLGPKVLYRVKDKDRRELGDSGRSRPVTVVGERHVVEILRFRSDPESVVDCCFGNMQLAFRPSNLLSA